MSFYLGAYWGPRRETAEQGAHRLARCLSAIAPHSPLIANWYHEREGVGSPSPRPENWMLIPPHEDALAALLRTGVNRGDGTEEPAAQLGFRTALWNLKDEEDGGASISAHCGSWSQFAPPNNFLLYLPAPLIAPELYERHTARALIEAVVECWEPEWATWTSYKLRDLQDEHVAGKSRDWRSLKPGEEMPDGIEKPLGWATYFSRLPDSAPDLPSGAGFHKLGPGSLLTIGADPADVPADLLLAVRDLLGEKSLA